MQVQLLHLLSGLTEEQCEAKQPMQSGSCVWGLAHEMSTICLDDKSVCSLMHASTEA